MSISPFFQKQKSVHFFHFNKSQIKPFLRLVPPHSEIRLLGLSQDAHSQWVLLPILVKIKLHGSVYTPLSFSSPFFGLLHMKTREKACASFLLCKASGEANVVVWLTRQPTPTSPSVHGSSAPKGLLTVRCHCSR